MYAIGSAAPLIYGPVLITMEAFIKLFKNEDSVLLFFR